MKNRRGFGKRRFAQIVFCIFTSLIMYIIYAGPLYSAEAIMKNGKKIEGDMTFRVYYKSTIWKEKGRWLTLAKRAGFRGIALVAGFILVIVLLNLIFYYFLTKIK